MEKGKESWVIPASTGNDLEFEPEESVTVPGSLARTSTLTVAYVRSYLGFEYWYEVFNYS